MDLPGFVGAQEGWLVTGKAAPASAQDATPLQLAGKHEQCHWWQQNH